MSRAGKLQLPVVQALGSEQKTRDSPENWREDGSQVTRHIAETFGVTTTSRTKLRKGDVAGAMIADLVDYLAQPNAKFMEQEQIAPELPKRGE